MMDKRVIWVVLRVHLSCKCHTGNNIHGEAAKTPAKHTRKQKYEGGQKKDTVILISSVHCLCDYLWMSKASPDSAYTFKLFIRASVAVLMSGTIYRKVN